jgi:uncharacterized membrane protein
LTLVLFLATLLLIFVFTVSDGNILRIIFGLPFLLFLPGYSLVSALWVKGSELDGLERTALGLGLSIAIVILAGLGLNYTPWGITLISLVICLYCIIVLLVGVAWYRRRKFEPKERFVVNMGFFFGSIKTNTPLEKLMVWIVIVVIAVGLGLMSYIATHPPKERYTEIYLLDENGTIENYPMNLEVNENASIIIGVNCHEHENTTYNTLIRLVPENGTNVTLAQYSFSLDNEEEWRQVLDLNFNESGRFMLLVEVFKGSGSIAYVATHLWIDVFD